MKVEVSLTNKIPYWKFILYWKSCFNSKKISKERRKIGNSFTYKSILGTYKCPFKNCTYSFVINEKKLSFKEINDLIENNLKSHLLQVHKIKVLQPSTDEYI